MRRIIRSVKALNVCYRRFNDAGNLGDRKVGALRLSCLRRRDEVANPLVITDFIHEQQDQPRIQFLTVGLIKPFMRGNQRFIKCIWIGHWSSPFARATAVVTSVAVGASNVAQTCPSGRNKMARFQP